MVDAIIVGAGISGLACGFYLKRAGLSVTILEGADRVGGLIQTTTKDGYTLEYGPNSLRGDSLELQEIIDAVGLRERIRKPALTKTRNYIAANAKLIAVPRSPFELLRTPLISGKAKRYLLSEPFHKANSSGEDESVASFFRRRVGAEAVEQLIKPLMSGIYAGDAERLSLRSAFPKFYDYERNSGSLLRGMLKAPKREKPTLPRMFSFDTGLTALPQALQTYLQGSVKLNTRVIHVEQTNTTWRATSDDGAVTESKVLVLTTPLEVTRSLVDEAIAAEITPSYCPPISIVYLGFKKSDVRSPLDGFGFLVAPSEKADLLGCIYTSALFPDRAPEGYVMLTVLMGGATRPELTVLPEKELAETAIRAVRRYFHVSNEPTFVSSHTWSHSIPQYNIGHSLLLEKLAAIEAHYPCMFFGGNYQGGISIGSCITNAKSIAERIIGH